MAAGRQREIESGSEQERQDQPVFLLVAIFAASGW
jgi:hypothetical protein